MNRTDACEIASQFPVAKLQYFGSKISLATVSPAFFFSLNSHFLLWLKMMSRTGIRFSPSYRYTQMQIMRRYMVIVWASLVAQRLKRLPAVQETWVRSLGWEDPLEKEMATQSTIPAWRSPWMEELGGLQSAGLQESDTTEWLHFHFSLSYGDQKV